MKPSTTTIPTDLEELVLLENGKIVAAFINALPPRGGDLHGTSIDFFFEDGRSCSIDGFIIDVVPKEEAYLLRFGKAMEMDVWKNRLHAGTEKLIIETVDLHALWSGQGLEPILAGPREVRFYNRAGSGGTVGEETVFEAIHLYVPGKDDTQSVFLHASQDFPGDVVATAGIPASEFNLAN
jgi:hypothetical protein